MGDTKLTRGSWAAGWIAVGMRIERLGPLAQARLFRLFGTDNPVTAAQHLAELPFQRAAALLLIVEATRDDTSIPLARTAAAATKIPALNAADRSMLRKLTRARSTTAPDLIAALADLGPGALVGAAALTTNTTAEATSELDVDAGGAIAAARVARGMSAAELAAAVNVSEQTVRNWEIGRSLPRIATAEALVDLLELEGGAASALLSDRTRRDAPNSWLRSRRLAAGLTQEELADRTGVSKALIAAIETGGRQMSDDTRALLVDHLNEPVDNRTRPASVQRQQKARKRRGQRPDRFAVTKLIYLAAGTVDLPQPWGDLPDFSYPGQPGRDTVIGDAGVAPWQTLNPELEPEGWDGITVAPDATRTAILPLLAWCARHGITDPGALADATGLDPDDTIAVWDGTASGLWTFAEQVARTLRLDVVELVTPCANEHPTGDPKGCVDAYVAAGPLPLDLADRDRHEAAASLRRPPTPPVVRRGNRPAWDPNSIVENIERVSGLPVRVTAQQFGVTVNELVDLAWRDKPGLGEIAFHLGVPTAAIAPFVNPRPIEWWDLSWDPLRAGDDPELVAAFHEGGPARDRWQNVFAARFTLDRYRTWALSRVSGNLIASEHLADICNIPIDDVRAVDRWEASPTWLFAEAMAAAGQHPQVFPGRAPREPAGINVEAFAEAVASSNDRYYRPITAVEFHAHVLGCQPDDLAAIIDGTASPTTELCRRVSVAFPAVCTVENGERRRRNFTLE